MGFFRQPVSRHGAHCGVPWRDRFLEPVVIRFTLVLALTGLLATGCQSSRTADVPDRAADRAAIEKLSTAYQAAFLAGDAKALSALYADSAVVQPAGEVTVRGRTALDAYFAATNGQPVQETFTAAELVIAASGDVAYETGQTMAASGAGKYLTVYRKIDGQWRIAAESWSHDSGALPTTGSGNDLTGTYGWEAGQGAGCTLKMARRGSDSAQLLVECNRGAPSYNSGMAEGVVRVAQERAVLSIADFQKPCALRMQFKKDTVVVAQDGSDADCGFGHGVMADGTYARTSAALPSFDIDR